MDILIKEILWDNSRKNVFNFSIISLSDIKRIKIKDSNLRMLNGTPNDIVFKNYLRNDDYCLIEFLNQLDHDLALTISNNKISYEVDLKDKRNEHKL